MSEDDDFSPVGLIIFLTLLFSILIVAIACVVHQDRCNLCQGRDINWDHAQPFACSKCYKEAVDINKAEKIQALAKQIKEKEEGKDE